ncbi:hypothetical protein HYX19_04980 [Candidatus Woesearchaeota archaeon]|nr:hypothetical protein [Candidatus Woesearchaeota archaeon]
MGLENFEDYKKKDYQVMYSARSSAYRFDGSDQDKPTLPNITLIEAYMLGEKWIRHAETVCGAVIFNTITGEYINLSKARDSLEEGIRNYGMYGIVLPLIEKIISYEEGMNDVAKSLCEKIGLEHKKLGSPFPDIETFK